MKKTTKYEFVKAQLKAQIISGQYHVNDKLPTESELMQRYHVSRYTIRRAVGDLETEHYIYRVQGGGMFVNDWTANQSVTYSNKLIGVITTHIADYIFPNIITGIDHTLSRSGYSIILSNTQNDPKKERLSLVNMLENRLSGLIIEPTQSALPLQNDDLYRQLKALKLPTLFINARYPTIAFPFIKMADTKSGQALTEYLMQQGHQRLLGVFKVDDQQGVDRMNGFLTAYRQHAQLTRFSQMIMYQSSDDLQQIFRQISAKMQSPERPTAIVCYNDQLAIQVLDLLKTLHLKLPEEVSVVGFDDYQLARYLTPSLTSVVHPKEQMGYDAAKMMLDLIAGRQVTNIEYTPEIIKRNSVAKL